LRHEDETIRDTSDQICASFLGFFLRLAAIRCGPLSTPLPKDALVNFHLIELSFPVAPETWMSDAGFKPCHFVVEISLWVVEPDSPTL